MTNKFTTPENKFTTPKNEFTTPEGKEWLKKQLMFDRTEVVFTKKDGTERKMLCTINQNYITEEAKPKGLGHAKSEEALAVFDVELKAWRSFRFDSIKSVSLLV
jgi:hypothetical protein